MQNIAVKYTRYGMYDVKPSPNMSDHAKRNISYCSSVVIQHHSPKSFLHVTQRFQILCYLIIYFIPQFLIGISLPALMI